MKDVEATISNSIIRATCKGKITFLHDLNEGDTAPAGVQICTILPQQNDLKVILYVPEYEITKIKVGQKAEYEFEAIAYGEYGKLEGEVLSIAADYNVDAKTGVRYFTVHADLPKHSMKNKAGVIREVKSGMVVKANAITGSKKAIVFLLEKLNLKL